MENFIFCAVSVKELYNIYTRETCLEKTNANKSYEIGKIV